MRSSVLRHGNDDDADDHGNDPDHDEEEWASERASQSVSEWVNEKTESQMETSHGARFFVFPYRDTSFKKVNIENRSSSV